MTTHERLSAPKMSFEQALATEPFQDAMREIFSDIDEYNSQKVAEAYAAGFYIPKGENGRLKDETQKTFGKTIVVGDKYFEPKEYFRHTIGAEFGAYNQRVAEYEAFLVGVGADNLPHAEHYVEITHEAMRGSGIYIDMIPSNIVGAFGGEMDKLVATLRKLKQKPIAQGYEYDVSKKIALDRRHIEKYEIGYEPSDDDLSKLASLIAVHGDHIHVYLPQIEGTGFMDVNGDEGEHFIEMRKRVGYDIFPKTETTV